MKILIGIIGTISLIFGTVGIFLPLLPTTPFILLAAICYSRSSKRLYNWLLTSKYLGKYISDYNNRCINHRSRQISLILLWAGIIFSIIKIENIYIDILLVVILIGVTIHLYSLNTI